VSEWTRIIDEHGLKLRAIYATHGHPDHISAAPMLAKQYNVPWYLHSGDFRIVGWGNDLLTYFGLPQITVDDVRPTLLDVQDTTVLPGVTMKIIETPGHTPGCCSYVLTQEDGAKWVLAGDAAKNRGELRTEEVQMSLDPQATSNSLRRIKAVANRVLPGHDGWVTIQDGQVLPEGGNDKVLVFGQGITINGGQNRVVLHMD
jgi:glyoxylase-like metal-dependent hydrolase (beta-lactamase superfamily II)